MRRLLSIVSIVSIVVICASSAHAKSKAPAAAPAFSLPTRADSVALDSLKGKVVLLDFWASWCGPCRRSFPWMNALNERFGKQGLVIVAVNLDKSRKDALEFLDHVPASFTVAFDPEARTAEAYQVKGMPTSYLISPDGRILETHLGFDPRHTPAIEAAIAEALPK